jgi:hypothetical protein
LTGVQLRPFARMDSDGVFAAGVFLSIFISCCNSLGMGLQKRVHKKLSMTGAAGEYYKDPGWVVGLVCMTIASVGSLGNYALLGQSRASAMASITIVTNAIMAKYFLGEYIGLMDVLVIAVITVGVTIAVVYGATAGAQTTTTLTEICALLSRDAVYVATALIVLYAGFAELATRVLRARALTGKQSNAEAKLECFLRAFTAGLFSGSTGFFAKAVVATIGSMAATHSSADLAKWQFWLFLIGLPCSILFQLRGLNAGLRYFDVSQVVPIYQSSIIFVSTTRRAARPPALTPLRVPCFAVGRHQRLGVLQRELGADEDGGDDVRRRLRH